MSALRNVKLWQMTPPLWADSEEELKSLLKKVKEDGKKVGLKLNIQKTKIMASGPITSWQIDGETVTDFGFFLGGIQNHCRWWFAAKKLKDTYFLESKLDQLSILKRRDITFKSRLWFFQ